MSRRDEWLVGDQFTFYMLFENAIVILRFATGSILDIKNDRFNSSSVNAQRWTSHVRGKMRTTYNTGHSMKLTSPLKLANQRACTIC